MRSTGIRRKVDDLGRVVIPAGVRRSLGIREGDALEVSVEGDQVILAKPRDRCVFCGSEDGPLQSFRGRVVCRPCVASVAVLDDGLRDRAAGEATGDGASSAAAADATTEATTDATPPAPTPAADGVTAPSAVPQPATPPAASTGQAPAREARDERAARQDERRQQDLAALERERQADYDPASTTAW